MVISCCLLQLFVAVGQEDLIPLGMGRFDRLLQLAQKRMVFTPGRPAYLLLARLDLAVTELKDGI